MIYELRLAGAEQDDGKIDLQRLALIAQSLTDIAKGALQIRLLGVSAKTGKQPGYISDALKIRLSDIKKGSTVLELECEPFSETLQGLQGNVFYAAMLEELPDQTPMALVVNSFREALSYSEETSHLDKPLLKKLKGFERIFAAPDEAISISNQGSIEELQLHKDDFRKIQTLDESIPDPQEIIINGVLDELKFSNQRITINTEEGMIRGTLGDDLDRGTITKYWGSNLTIAGTAHYLPSGKISFLIVERIFEPSGADSYFSRLPKKETIEQQIQRKQKHLRYGNYLAEIVGQWPGEERIEEILNALD